MFVTSNWILFQTQQDLQSSIYYESKDLPFYGISQGSRFSIQRNWVGIRGRHAFFFSLNYWSIRMDKCSHDFSTLNPKLSGIFILINFREKKVVLFMTAHHGCREEVMDLKNVNHFFLPPFVKSFSSLTQSSYRCLLPDEYLWIFHFSIISFKYSYFSFATSICFHASFACSVEKLPSFTKLPFQW